jgi:hypothetical protein
VAKLQLEVRKSMAHNNVSALTALFVSCGIMLGAGLGAAFGNVAIGIPAGMAAGGLASVLLHISQR